MLELVPEARETLIEHAREGVPEEVCGVLAGTTAGEDARVEITERVPNVAPRPASRYELDPEVQIEVMRAIEDTGNEVIGFYHSHPRGPAGPSETDAAQAAWPGYRYVIVSLGAGVNVGSWVWDGEGFQEEVVHIDGRP